MLFEDSAMDLVANLIPPPGPVEVEEALRQAFPRAWRVGLTAIHDMDGLRAFAAYERLHAEGELGLRVAKYLPPEVLEGTLEHSRQGEATTGCGWRGSRSLPMARWALARRQC
jgi:predicted amidohydrolase YtcJ